MLPRIGEPSEAPRSARRARHPSACAFGRKKKKDCGVMSHRRFDSSGPAFYRAAAAPCRRSWRQRGPLRCQKAPGSRSRRGGKSFATAACRKEAWEGGGKGGREGGSVAAVLTDVVLDCFLSTRSHLRGPSRFLFSIPCPPCHTIPPSPYTFLPLLLLLFLPPGARLRSRTRGAHRRENRCHMPLAPS